MPHENIEKTLSTSRFSTYKKAILTKHGYDCPISALTLYEWNAELSSHFFFPLHIYEVVLRNAISDAIALRYGETWYNNEIFTNSLKKLDKKTLSDAVEKDGSSVGKVLPEIKFYWFENMLTKRHDGRIWEEHINIIFPSAPTTLDHKQIREKLKDSCYVIRKFRNRCGHHEPIFNNQRLQEIYPMLAETIKWRCNDTYKWLNEKEKVTSLLSAPII